MSGHSIRLRFVGWLRSLIDQCRKHVTKYLRVDQSHSVARNDTHLGGIVPIGVDGRQAQIDDAAGDAAFRNKVAEYHRSLAVDNLSGDVLGQRIDVAGLNNHFIAHQKFPKEIVNFSNLNSKLAGVQP